MSSAQMTQTLSEKKTEENSKKDEKKAEALVDFDEENGLVIKGKELNENNIKSAITDLKNPQIPSPQNTVLTLRDIKASDEVFGMFIHDLKSTDIKRIDLINCDLHAERVKQLMQNLPEKIAHLNIGDRDPKLFEVKSSGVMPVFKEFCARLKHTHVEELDIVNFTSPIESNLLQDLRGNLPITCKTVRVDGDHRGGPVSADEILSFFEMYPETSLELHDVVKITHEEGDGKIEKVAKYFAEKKLGLNDDDLESHLRDVIRELHHNDDEPRRNEATM